MYRCAGIYVERFHLPIECRYLCCSLVLSQTAHVPQGYGGRLWIIYAEAVMEVTLDRIP